MKRARLNIEIGRAAHDRLTSLKERTSAPSLSSVIRVALELLERLVDHQKDNGVVVFRSKDGSEKVVEFFFPTPN